VQFEIEAAEQLQKWQPGRKTRANSPMTRFGELLPKREIFQDEIPAASKQAYECSDPEVEHATGLYQINGWRDGCNLLILRRAGILGKDSACLTEPRSLDMLS
jgi:hypothetical protein